MRSALLGVCIVLLWGALIASYVLSARVFRELREQHPVTWTEMGEPESVFARRGSYWALEKFCFSGDYLALASPRLTRLCNRLLVCKVVLYASLAAFMLGHAR